MVRSTFINETTVVLEFDSGFSFPWLSFIIIHIVLPFQLVASSQSISCTELPQKFMAVQTENDKVSKLVVVSDFIICFFIVCKWETDIWYSKIDTHSLQATFQWNFIYPQYYPQSWLVKQRSRHVNSIWSSVRQFGTIELHYCLLLVSISVARSSGNTNIWLPYRDMYILIPIRGTNVFLSYHVTAHVFATALYLSYRGTTYGVTIFFMLKTYYLTQVLVEICQ